MRVMFSQLFLPVSLTALRVFHELMLEQLIHIEALLYIFLETGKNELPHGLVVILWLEGRHRLSHDIKLVSLLISTHEWRHEVSELVRRDADCPHIDALAIRLAVDELRRHPIDGAALRCTSTFLLGQEY